MSRDNYLFSQVPVADIPRSKFNRSHGHKTTFDAGYLVPIYVDEVLPGDTFNVNGRCFARLATPVVPVMDNLHMDFFFFFVPNRLVWDNWERMMGQRDNPDDSTDFLVPQIQCPSGGYAELSIYDYMGLPVGINNCFPTALPFRAYNLVYNEWFRDQNLIDRVTVPKDDGPDPHTNYNLVKRGKRHDYFTSCLPWPQKGDGVELPIGASAPIIADGSGFGPSFDTMGAPQGPNYLLASTIPGETGAYQVGSSLTGANLPLVWSDPHLVADLSNATAATINSLRQAFQIQKLLERDARGGTRYVEVLKSHFGVVSPDFRLQRPEYLGGGNVLVSVNPVVQTSASGTYADTPQGNLTAYGTAKGSGLGFTKSFVEHGYVIGLVCVRADLSYQQGMHRMWSRRSRFDFYWPVFAHLGEQAVLNKEIYFTGDSPAVIDDAVFGYQERWAEYRYFPSKITGRFRSQSTAPLDVWHLAQEFSALPTLNKTFIEEDPPVARMLAVQNEPQFLFDSYWQIECTRPMPVYSVPGMIDHF